jgi:hypothetical protein
VEGGAEVPVVRGQPVTALRAGEHFAANQFQRLAAIKQKESRFP